MSEAVYFGPRAATGAGKGGARARAAGKGRAAPFAFLLAAAALVVVALVSIAAPSLQVRTWEVSGAAALGREAVLAWAGIEGGEAFFGVDAEALRLRIAAHPEVAAVAVTKRFPDAVEISIVPRVPAALILAERGGATKLVAVDAQGVLMREGSVREAASLPLVSGLALAEFDWGARMPARFAPFLAALARIGAQDPGLLAHYSEIRVARKEGESFDLVLYALDVPVQLLAPSTLSAGLLEDMALTLGMLASWEGGRAVESVDFRAETVTFRTREGGGLER